MGNAIYFMNNYYNEDDICKYGDVTVEFDIVRNTWINLHLKSPNFKEIYLSFFCYSDDSWNVIMEERYMGNMSREEWINTPHFSFEYNHYDCDSPLETRYVMNYFGDDYSAIMLIINECRNYFIDILTKKEELNNTVRRDGDVY